MMARLYKKEDHAMLSEWWTARNFPIVSPDLLPEYGVIVEDYCAGFVIKTDTKFCMIEWLVSNPNTDKVKRNEAMNMLLDVLVEVAKDLGFHYTFSSLQDPKLIDRFEKSGFPKTDLNVTNFFRRI